MRTVLLSWAALVLPWAVVCSAALEFERRRSAHGDVRRFVRLPAVAGVAAGLLWPVVAVVLLAFGVVWVVGRCGRTVCDLSGVRDGSGPAA